MHEIMERDNVVLHRERAWHGLGIIVKDAPTPREALSLIDADWNVEQLPMVAVGPTGDQLPVESHVLNVRGDDPSVILGVVGKDYKVVHNREIADFAEALAEAGDVVTCETAGTIRNGQRIWFLLKGDSFSIRGDEVAPYICLSGGHDGKCSVRGTPTTVRTVCSNTLHMVIPDGRDTGEVKSGAFVCRHSGSIRDKLDDAKRALRLYQYAQETTIERMQDLARVDVTEAKLAEFFRRNWERDFWPIPSNPQDDRELRRMNRAYSAMHSFSQRWDDERGDSGSNLWTAFNAYSGLLQHDRKAHGKDDADRIQRRIESNLFGLTADRTSKAFAEALTMAS